MSTLLKTVAILIVVGGAALLYFVRHDEAKPPQGTYSAESSKPGLNGHSAPDKPFLANENESSSDRAGMVEIGDTKNFSKKNGIDEDFYENQKCYKLLDDVDAIDRKIAICNRIISVSDENHEQNKKCRIDSARYEIEMSSIENEVRYCLVNKVDIDKAYYDSVKKAAKNGNHDAQICYLKSEFNENGVPRQYSAQDIAEYRSYGNKYLSDALNRGDWRVVQLLSNDRHSESSGLLPLIIKDNVFTAYAMNRLLHHGAIGEYARDLDVFADGHFRSNGQTGKGVLTASQIAEANRWAKDTYQKSFKSSPPLKEKPSVCE